MFRVLSLLAALVASTSFATAEATAPGHFGSPTAAFAWLFGDDSVAPAARTTRATPARSVFARTGTPQQQPRYRSSGSRSISPAYMPRLVPIETKHPKGTIIVDTRIRYLFLVLGNGQAMRYGVGVGRPGFEWAGTHRVTRKSEWPSWTPPAAMRKRQPGLPVHMKGGPENPLGARALYLGSTLYRIHGSNQPWTIGQAVSSGCIRMRNEDVIDLYSRVRVGAKVIVL